MPFRSDTHREDIPVNGCHKRRDVVFHGATGNGVYSETRGGIVPDDRLHNVPESVGEKVPVETDGMAREKPHEQRPTARRDEAFRLADGHRPFYSYYQISGEDESDEAEDEPKKEGELRTEYEGSHSLFGFVWQVASATGWSIGYILNGVNYQTLIMMLSDAPRYVRRKINGTGGDSSAVSAEDEANNIVGFFRSKLDT